MTAGGAPVLACEGLSFCYGERGVLHGVDFSVAPGRLCGLLGPNGSGKSTLLGVLCGLVPPGGHVTAGVVHVLGRRASEWRRRDLARRLAAVEQRPGLDPDFTVFQTILMGRLPFLGRFAIEGPADLAAARRAVALCALADVVDRPVGALSGGEQHRVHLARALAQEPEVLLLDEVTADLDIRYRIAVMDLLAGLRDQGLTVVVVLHDLGLAAAYCDEVVLLHDGRLAAAGAPCDVLTAERVERVYGTRVWVGREPERGTPVIVPLPGALTGTAATTPRDPRPGRA
jgi:iron complex transport system ATP-binding protein